MNPRVAVIALVLAAISTTSVFAETKLDISGQVRVRNEIIQKSLSAFANGYYSNILRARLNVRAIVDSNAIAYLSLQDSRNFEGDLEATYSGDKFNSSNIDAHEAYLEIHSLPLGLWGKAGRFELASGNGRLLGTDDWDNVGRSWNGAQVGIRTPDLEIIGFGLTGPGADYPRSIQNLLWGIKGSFPTLNIEPLFYYENSDSTIYYQYSTGHSDVDRFTLSIFGKHPFASCELLWNAAYQFGTQNSVYTTMGNDYGYHSDLSAWMATVELSGRMTVADSIQWCAGVDFTSGNSGSDGESDRLFSSPYRSNGDFHGKGQFVAPYATSNWWAKNAGLIDSYFGLGFSPFRLTSFRLRVHHFATHHTFDSPMLTWAPDPEEQSFIYNARFLGWQPELTVTTSLIRGLRWELGATLFEPSKAYARDYNPNTGYYAYSQMTVDF